MRIHNAIPLIGLITCTGLAAAGLVAAGLMVTTGWPATARLPETHIAAGQTAPQLTAEPLAAALAAVGAPPSSSRSTRVVSRSDSQATVEVVDDRLPDDSVAAVRHQVNLRLEGGIWHVSGDIVAYRCQPGRGSPLAGTNGGWQQELCL